MVPSIRIRGASQNNLKSIDLNLPLGKLIVLTGPSGSGKSSLAFDTIYAEGQRRYVETFSPYTRQFLERMDKPSAEAIEGIPPAIAIEQANHVKTSRSTVGTITEINDYLKLLFTRAAKASCPSCSRPVQPESPQSIVRAVEAAYSGRSLLITFPVGTRATATPGDPENFFRFLNGQGYLRVWLYGRLVRTDERAVFQRLPPFVLVVQDRVALTPENRPRLTEAVESALALGKDRVVLVDAETSEQLPFSSGWHCAHCDIDIRPPSPGLFSFNNPLGACPQCRGFGRVIGIDYGRVLPDKSLSIAQGLVKPFQSGQSRECQRDLMRCAEARGVDVNAPFNQLPEPDQHWIIHGEGTPDLSGDDLWQNGLWYGVKGFFHWLESRTYKMHIRVFLSRYRSYLPCAACNGGRFQPDTLNYRLPPANLTLPEAAALNVARLVQAIRDTTLPAGDPGAILLRDQILSRLSYLDEVGLGYLSLDRPTRTLSGGEIERVNLTTCLGASLVNTLFVMDEPSVGLHPRDTERLIHVMEALRDKGNTLLVVEHDETVIRAADHVVDIGPGRGEAGGRVVFSGKLAELENADGSLTADYLSGRKRIAVPARRRPPKGFLELRGVQHHNIRNLDVRIPLGVLCCVTGVSGSGKSTLVHDVLYRGLAGEQSDDAEAPGHCDGISGDDEIDEVVMVDQSPLARSPRSTPAVYLGVFDRIRDLFGLSADAIAAGLTPSSFSFNAGSGRCERCMGLGFEKVEMQFLSDLYLPCAECAGNRYQPHVLKILLGGRSIQDVLQMTTAQGIEFFEAYESHGEITGPLRLMSEVGLDYLRLGQPVNVLSGGESQRLKLVRHLIEKREKGALLIFDEPTTGLHADDVAQLLAVFQRLVHEGDSIVVIEHNLEVIKCADWIVDLGPDAGDQGGTLVAEGTPENVSRCGESPTARHLARMLDSTAGVAEVPVRYQARASGNESLSIDRITVRGAREHNLKNVSVEIPRDQMVVITGLSGSGKSTLAFDILFAEGQRRFLDSMSPYARQFVQQLEKPEVDAIDGLPPSVAIEQRVTRGGGKSTVATITEVYHFLRLLFSKAGTQHCPECKCPVEKLTASAIAQHVEKLAMRGRIQIFAPLVKARKGFHTKAASWAKAQGFEFLLVDGSLTPVAAFQKLERFKEHSIDVLIGELVPSNALDALALVRRAIEIGRGTARVIDAKKGIHVLSTEMNCPSCGRAFEELDPRMFSFNSPHGWCGHCRGFGEVWHHAEAREFDSQLEADLAEERIYESLEDGQARPCPACGGTRINHTARAVQITDRTIVDFIRSPAVDALDLLRSLRLSVSQKTVAKDIVAEIEQRLLFLIKVGLDYLTLDRAAKTLSGGESQRIRLAAQLGSNLRGVLYVLDEPTIGLHPSDNARLLEALEQLAHQGNSLVIVEHDEDTIRRANHIIDLGPRAGRLGGEIVARGTLPEILLHPHSLTARYLRDPIVHPMRGARRPLGTEVTWLELIGANKHNLNHVDVRIPLNRFSVITGISGSGKSTLLRGVLVPAVKDGLNRSRSRSADKCWDTIRGVEHLGAVLEMDQTPIGKTSRSTPATYVKVLDEIRAVFAQLPAARMRGYTASRFSFNNQGGRCEACLGQGVIKLEMNFLPVTYMPCEECGGKRFNIQTLEIEYNGRSIGDVMGMTVEQAAEFFSANPKIKRSLDLLVETGLGYLQLGQPSPTLSGGEAQRIKLVTQLSRRATPKAEAVRTARKAKSTLYVLEEPTIGLHTADVESLMHVLHRLVDEGGTVIVIEHQLDVIAEADYIVDLGPGAGALGGEVVAAGTPEYIAENRRSRTAPHVKQILQRTTRALPGAAAA